MPRQFILIQGTGGLAKPIKQNNQTDNDQIFHNV